MPNANDPITTIRNTLTVLKADGTGTGLVLDVLKRCGEYVSAVVALEAGYLMIADGDDYRQTIQGLDRRRSQCHDALIDAVIISCRYLNKNYPGSVPDGGIYPDPTHLLERNRRAIGDWAGKISNALFLNRS